MRVCHITPYLSPHQAAEALLPVHLGRSLSEAGDEPTYVAHASARVIEAALPGPVTWVPQPANGTALWRLTNVSMLASAARIARAVRPSIQAADIVHVHGRGLLAEVSGTVASWQRKPLVLSLYGHELWDYRRRRLRLDLFTRVYRHATHVTFRSQSLSARAQELGLARRETSVIYPAVGADFTWHDFDGQAEARSSLGLRHRHLIVNVRRLHPLAGQRYLIEAMGEVIRTHPDTRLIICGAGPMLNELKSIARTAGVEGHVTFAGLLANRIIALYCAAADVFVLPSLLDACPTVAVEALACGTPVITTDNPGGVELNDLFGTDVTLTPREKPLRLARTLVDLLQNKRRTRASTRETIERDFRPATIAAQFRAVYERTLGASSK